MLTCCTLDQICPPAVSGCVSTQCAALAHAFQVEHGITELVNGGVDLVEWMLRLQLPQLEPLDLRSLTTERSGHSIEVSSLVESGINKKK